MAFGEYAHIWYEEIADFNIDALLPHAMRAVAARKYHSRLSAKSWRA